MMEDDTDLIFRSQEQTGGRLTTTALVGDTTLGVSVSVCEALTPPPSAEVDV